MNERAHAEDVVPIHIATGRRKRRRVGQSDEVADLQAARERRKLREYEQPVAHAEFAEYALGRVRELPRIIKSDGSETVVGLRSSDRELTFCFTESRRVFITKDRVTVEVEPQGRDVIDLVIAIAERRVDGELPIRGLDVIELADVSATFQRVFDERGRE